MEYIDEMVDFMRGFTRKLILWAGPDAVKAYSEFHKASANHGGKKDADPIPMMAKLEDFFLALREDLGHSNKGIQTGDILGIVISAVRQWI